ncbi:hypothetical protein Ancab_010767 [Ancistrocladus abbreviatus]
MANPQASQQITSCEKFIVHLKDYEYAIGAVNPIGYTLEKLKNDLKIHALLERPSSTFDDKSEPLIANSLSNLCPSQPVTEYEGVYSESLDYRDDTFVSFMRQYGSLSRLRIEDRDAYLSDGLGAQVGNLGEGGCTDDVSINDD